MRNEKLICINNIKIPYHKLIDFLSSCRVDEETLRFIIKEFEKLEPTKEKVKEFWEVVSKTQQLSESFIEEFQDYLNWYWISETQELSEDFIKKHIDKIQSSIFLNLHIAKLSDELINMLDEKFEDEKELKELKKIDNELIYISKQLKTTILDDVIKSLENIIYNKENKLKKNKNEGGKTK
jgi:hypothetical protein